MTTTLQTLLLRWFPIAAIAFTEIVLFAPVRRAVAVGGWAPILSLAAFAVALVVLMVRGLPNPNGRTPVGYALRLVEFAVVFAAIASVPGRHSGI